MRDTRCRTEVFHFNAEGDELLTSSEYFCGTGKFERQSFLNRAVISYISQGRDAPAVAGVGAAALVPKLKDKLPARITSSSTTAATTSTSTTEAALVELQGGDDKQAEEHEEGEEEDDEQEQQNDDGDDDDDFSNEVLHVLQDVGVSDALAYVASLLYDEERNSNNNNERQRIGIGSTPAPSYLQLAQLPGGTPKTSAKRGKIVSLYPLGVPGGGRFSCLVEALLPSCNCGWSRIQRIASPTNDEAALHEFPSMAGVLTKKQGKVFCGAAISEYEEGRGIYLYHSLTHSALLFRCSSSSLSALGRTLFRQR